MANRTETVVFPAFLASALINGDLSGLEPDDLPWVAKAVEYCEPGYIVSCGEESFFSWTCDLPGFSKGADMMEFTVMYTDKE
jgi:hypothetical protein